MDSILQLLILEGHITQEEFDRQVEEHKNKNRQLNPDEEYQSSNSSSLSLDEIKNLKIKQIKYLRDITIISGFQSTTVLTSTSKAHYYGSDPYDQANMTGKLAQMNANPTMTQIYFKVLDDNIYASHSRTEFSAICNEGISHIENCLLKCESLESQVNAKTVKDEIDLINW